ncbi:MAG: uracil-DNA glycosylase [Rhodomicrobium sp.]
MNIAPQNAAILLEWYRAMGVDEAIAPAPQDWYAEVPPLGAALSLLNKPAEPAINPPLPGRKAAPRLEPALRADIPAAGGADAMAARELARSAADLAGLRALLETFDGCTLKQTATRLCLSRGSPDARIMLIGEAPGKDEDAKGLPFVGRAGQLLDRMLAAIGLTGEDVYITNLVFWRPPGNRTPSPEEVQVCEPFVERQIELLSPELLIFLGNAAAKQLTGASEGIMKLRGKWLSYRGIRAMATLHPAYLLRNPIAKRLAWRDLLSIREALDEVKEDRHGRN